MALTTATNPAGALVGRTKFAILEAVRAEPAPSLHALARRIGVSKTATRSALETLCAAGIVKVVEEGRRSRIELEPAHANLVDVLSALGAHATPARARRAVPALSEEPTEAEYRAFATYFATPSTVRTADIVRPEQRVLSSRDDDPTLSPTE